MRKVLFIALAICFYHLNTNLFAHSLIQNDIDLSLYLSSDDPTPSQWSTYSLQLTLRNDGPQTATDIVVQFSSPDGVKYVGGNEFQTSAGSFYPYGSETWELASLPPGGEVQLRVNYFLSVADAPTAYAQIVAANETDIDSTPNNGTPPSVNEDDEASTDDSPPPPTSDEGCGFLKEAGFYADINFDAYNFVFGSESSDAYTILGENVDDTETEILDLEIDKNGEFVGVSSALISVDPAPEQVFITKFLPDLIIQYQDINGTFSWATVLSFDDYDIADYLFTKAFLTEDGIFVLGSFVTPSGDNLFNGFVAKLSLDGAIESVVVNDPLPDELYILSAEIHKVTGGYVFDVLQQVTQNELAFTGVSADGTNVWNHVYASDLPSNTHIHTEVSPDRNYIYAADVNNSFAYLEKVDAQTGAVVYDKNLDIDLAGYLDVLQFRSSFNWDDFLLLDNGGVVLGYDYLNISSTSIDGYVFTELDADGNIVWANHLDGERTLQPLIKTEDGGYLFASRNADANALSIMKITEDGSLTPTCGDDDPPSGGDIDLPCDLSYTLTNDNLTISGSGLDAGNVIIKLFDPNWNTYFTCNGDCGNSISIDGVNMNGIYRLEIRTFDTNWNPLCEGLVEIAINNTMGRAVNEVIDEHDIQIQKEALFSPQLSFYPNPATNEVTIELERITEVSTSIYLSNTLGSIIDIIPLELNQVQARIDLSSYQNGLYLLQIVSTNGKSSKPQKLMIVK